MERTEKMDTDTLEAKEIEPTVREAIRDLTKRTSELEKIASAMSEEIAGHSIENKDEFKRILTSDILTMAWMITATFMFVKLGKELDTIRELVVKAE